MVKFNKICVREGLTHILKMTNILREIKVRSKEMERQAMT